MAALTGGTSSEPVGSLGWLIKTEGRLSFRDRFMMVLGAGGALLNGLRLGQRAIRTARNNPPLAALEPPDTAMLRAARAYVEARCRPSMVNHSVRTAFWTTLVLQQHDALTESDAETAWVAALLHDIGLEHPPAKGDFTLAGIEALRTLAKEHAWSDEQTHWASEAITANLAVRVDVERSGKIAWAMNAGGLGELGFGLHRRQLHVDRIRELEARYPRGAFRREVMPMIAEEARRMPTGRFAFLGRFFPLIMRD